MIELTEPQQRAVEAAVDFARHSEQQCFTVFGYAGTGKTTVLSRIAAELPEARCAAFTGKATAVLKRKLLSQTAVSTVHGLFYRPVEYKDPITGVVTLSFVRVHESGEMSDLVVLLDEVSMISSDMLDDLFASGAKIIAFGDPGQLPPVKGTPAFERADIMFTEVHRQAAESPIIRQATRVRNGERYKPDGERFQIKELAADDDLVSHDIVLCWRNDTRHALNKHIRKLKGFKGVPRAGEAVLCLKNYKAKGLCNGEIYTLAADYNAKEKCVHLRDPINDRLIDVPNAVFLEPGQKLEDFQQKLPTAFDFGHAITVHKAQGSEWDSVLLVDECKMPNRKNWVYTGITRASQSVTIVR